MAALAAGHDSALSAIMERWRQPVAAFLYRMTGQHDAANDLAQETFVRVYQARLRYDARGRFSTWLFSIAANLARNFARWRSRHPEVSLPDDDTREDPGYSPSAAAAARERSEAVQKAITSLPPDLREALVLSVYHDLSHAEIATTLGCTAKAVETRIYRARQALRESLKAWA